MKEINRPPENFVSKNHTKRSRSEYRVARRSRSSAATLRLFLTEMSYTKTFKSIISLIIYLGECSDSLGHTEKMNTSNASWQFVRTATGMYCPEFLELKCIPKNRESPRTWWSAAPWAPGVSNGHWHDDDKNAYREIYEYMVCEQLS